MNGYGMPIASADEDGRVTLYVGCGYRTLTTDEAREYAEEIAAAAGKADALQRGGESAT